MKLAKMTWLYLAVGVLESIVVLRDIFAPGFFTISNRVMSRSGIILEVVTAIVFLGIAALSHKRQYAHSLEKK